MAFRIKCPMSLLVLLLSSKVIAATPSAGLPLQVRHGFFTETNVGGLFTLGGDDSFSNTQVYLQLGLGYQFTVQEAKILIPLGLNVGISANAANCWSGRTASLVCPESDNFTITFFSFTGGFLHQLVERLYIGPKAIFGWTLLNPDPIKGVSGGFNVGAAVSLEYATNMDHFSVGLDIGYRMIIGPNISVLSFFPRVQYTF